MNRVAVIIVNWNGYSYTRACLYSLTQDSYLNKEVFVVDNASTDNSLALLTKEFDKINYISLPHNTGFTGGNNEGIRQVLTADFDFILLLNNDTEVDPDFLQPLVEVLQNNTDVAAVQPKMLFKHNEKLIWNAGGEFNAWWGTSRSVGLRTSDAGKFDVAKPTDWITGCCILVRTSVIRQVGRLDDRYFAYWEDVDLSLRIRKAGWKLWYEPKSKIYHWAGVSSTAKQKGKEGYLSPEAILWEVRNHIFIVRTHGKLPQVVFWWLYQLGKWILFAGYFVLRRRWTKLSMVFRGIREGLTA